MSISSIFLLLVSFFYLLSLSATNAQSQILCIEKEKQALLDFKLSFVSPSLPTWTNSSTDDCCYWEGVGCEFSTGHVVSLMLGGEGLKSSKLRPSLLELQHLTSLDFSSYNQLYMRIPEFIGSLRNLNSLDLSDGGFFGEIPPHLGNLSNLQDLNLGQSTGMYAHNLQWLSRLSSIQSIEFSNVNLSKALDWASTLKTLPTLSAFICDSCSLPTPPLSSISHMNSSNSLQTLDLSYNTVSSAFSYLINDTSKLQSLSLDHMKLDQDNLHELLDSVIRSSRYSLDRLTLPGNNLNILPFGGMMLPSLTDLDASSNNISGNLSDILQYLPPNITDLDLSSNLLSGTILDAHLSKISDINDLNTIDLSNNAFHGPIPPFLFRALTSVDLSNNKFSSFSPLQHKVLNYGLTRIDLSNNHLSGLLPDWIVQFDHLFTLNLVNNTFSGTLPDAIGSLWQLTTLHLSNNNFSGQLPLSMRNCTQLVILELANNKFFGPMPSWVGEGMEKLVILTLSSNKFYGDLPSSLCHLQSLQILDLSDNRLSGTIPACIHNLSSMATYKSLSSVFTYGEGLLYIYLYLLQNDSSSVIWKGKSEELDIHNLEQRAVINLSGNLFRGEIPIGVTTLKELKSLDLSRNYLNGSIPDKIGQLTSLEVLKLSSNRLSGEIPRSLASLTFLGTLNLSNNNLSGQIPTSTQLQSFDTSTYAGNPNLCGEPLLKKCPGDEGDGIKQPSNEDDDESFSIQAFLAALGVGFLLSFLGVLGTLQFNRQWRLAFFQLSHNIAERICVETSIFQSRIKRRLCFI